MIFSLRASRSLTHASAGVGRWRSARSIFIACSLAPPCSGPLSVPMRRRDGGVHVGHRRRGHPRGEGRSVEFVLGVQGEHDVHRVRLPRLGLAARQAKEESRRVRQVAPGRNRAAAVRDAPTAGHQRRDPAIRRMRLSRLASWEWSFSSGSNIPSIETPVRSTSLGGHPRKQAQRLTPRLRQRGVRPGGPATFPIRAGDGSSP